MRRAGFGVKKGLQPTLVARGRRKRGTSGSNLSVVDLWRGVEWLWWNCGGGEGGINPMYAVPCLLYIPTHKPTNPPTPRYQDWPNFFRTDLTLMLLATVYLEHYCYIFISGFPDVGNIDR